MMQDVDAETKGATGAGQGGVKMGREVPFGANKACDECGKLGAYDFMGDCYCPECVERLVREAGEDEDQYNEG